MVTIEQKLSLFSKLLQQDISNEISGKMDQLEKEYEIKMRENKERVDQKAVEIIERAQKRAELKKTEYVSKVHMQTKREYIQAKEKQVNRFMDALISQIEDYTATEGYREYLEKLVLSCKELVEESNLVIYMTEQDLKKYQKHIGDCFEKIGMEKSNLSFKEKDATMLGGMVIENQTKTMRIDLSIASRMREQKEKIIKRIFEALGEVGE